jgi:serine/threonine-protein kinase
LPDDADFETGDGREFPPPVLDQVTVREEVGHVRGDRRQGGSQNPRQAQQGDLDVELGQLLPLADQAVDRVATSQEQVELARFCVAYKERPRTAVGLFADAFRADPKLADDLKEQYRYEAASVAALASAGKGEDAKGLSAEQRGKLRQQALDWLRADLTAYTKHAEKDNKRLRQAVHQRLSHWLQDADLAGLREPKELATLPQPEGRAWQRFWADVEALRKKVEVKP